jgi:hypothetical protein
VIKTITLATLPEATAAEVFNFVAHHLLTQFAMSAEESRCRYRIGNLKCAAGCLISDDEYDKDYESISWTGLSKGNLVPAKHSLLIQDLQQIHDGDDSPKRWPERIEKLAKTFGYTIEPEVQALIEMRSA